MQLEAWDESTKVTFDRQLWAELTSLRFVTESYNVLIMGPAGVSMTFLANALGHAAVRRKWTVHSERADKLFKRLRAARLDHTYDEEMRKLHRVELPILDDLALPDGHPQGCGPTRGVARPARRDPGRCTSFTWVAVRSTPRSFPRAVRGR